MDWIHCPLAVDICIIYKFTRKKKLEQIAFGKGLTCLPTCSQLTEKKMLLFSRGVANNNCMMLLCFYQKAI